MKDDRPQLNQLIEKALKLYDTKQHTVKEIEEMTSVSKATLYREIRKQKMKKEIV